MSTLWAIVWSVTPTVAVGLIFWFVMRAVIHADRNERKTYAKIEREERNRATAGGSDDQGSGAGSL